MISELMTRARLLWRGKSARTAPVRAVDEGVRVDKVPGAAGPSAQRPLSFHGFPFSWLDITLALRMLRRYPVITVVGGLAMAFAIWVGAISFEFGRQVLYPSLPLPQGDRIVAIEMRNTRTNAAVTRIAHDFIDWRSELRTIRELGAYRVLDLNLVATDGRSAPTRVAEITTSAFPFTRVAPLLGRTLVADDERAGAPAVAVIGHLLWQQRFASDSGVVGRTVHLGRTATTVVGVMPPGFGFPVAFNVWTPLRLRVLEYNRGEGPALSVFGRLAPGVSLAEAQAELATAVRQVAREHPRTHQHLRPQVLGYGRAVLGLSKVESLFIGSMNLILLLFLLLVCGNVALLMFARAATRESELVVRSALGAGRGRLVGQLFAEALVLGGLAAVVGLGAARGGTELAFRFALKEVDSLPFWFQPSLSGMTILYAALLTLLGAAVAGILPALRVTRHLQDRLRAAGGGGGGMRFSGVWTMIIVAQIAVTVVLPVIAWATQRVKAQLETMPVHIREAEFLAVSMQLDDAPSRMPSDDSSATVARRFALVSTEFARRVALEPRVAGVTFAERLPRMHHPGRLIELDAGGAAAQHPDWPGGHRVSSAAVATDYFPVMGAALVSGRNFHSGDLATNSRTVVVNEHFVEHVLGGRNPLGRHLRYVHREEMNESGSTDASQEPWYEIVGVVPTMGMAELEDPKAAGIYHPLLPDTYDRVQLAVHVRSGDPAALEPLLRGLAAAVDPALRVDRIAPVKSLNSGEVRLTGLWVRFTLVLTLIAVMLSLAGIYAVMAFTVARRTREIGIRVALGAPARRVVLTVLSRPLTQVAGGVGTGTTILCILLATSSEQSVGGQQVAILGVYALGMLGVCLLACIVPMRRALRIEPSEALRVDA